MDIKKIKIIKLGVKISSDIAEVYTDQATCGYVPRNVNHIKTEEIFTFVLMRIFLAE